MPRSAPRYHQRVAELTVRALDGQCAGYAGAAIGVDDRRITDVRRGRLKRFSLETLIRFATHSGVQLDLVERPSRSRRPF